MSYGDKVSAKSLAYKWRCLVNPSSCNASDVATVRQQAALALLAATGATVGGYTIYQYRQSNKQKREAKNLAKRLINERNINVKKEREGQEELLKAEKEMKLNAQLAKLNTEIGELGRKATALWFSIEETEAELAQIRNDFPHSNQQEELTARFDAATTKVNREEKEYERLQGQIEAKYRAQQELDQKLSSL